MTLGDQFVDHAAGFGNIFSDQGLGSVNGGIDRLEHYGIADQAGKEVAAFLAAEFSPHAGGYDQSPARGNGEVGRSHCKKPLKWQEQQK
jgi:hypothetical protein